MIVWDQGRWIPEAIPTRTMRKGHLDFTLEGERLKGKWHLVRMRGKPGENEQWLLLKSDDEAARTPDDPEILEEETTSVMSGRTIEELAAQGEIRIDHAERAKAARRGRRSRVRTRLDAEGAKKGFLPSLCRAGLANLVESAPEGASGCTRSSSTATACRPASTAARCNS